MCQDTIKFTIDTGRIGLLGSATYLSDPSPTYLCENWREQVPRTTPIRRKFEDDLCIALAHYPGVQEEYTMTLSYNLHTYELL